MGRTTFGFELDVRDNAKGLRQLYLRITKEKARAKVGTGLYIKAKDFNPKSRELPVRKGCDEHAAYNAALKRRLKEAEALVEDLAARGQELTAMEFKERLLGKADGTAEDLLAYGRRWLGRHQAKLAERTAERYHNYLRRLETYQAGKPLLFKKFTLTALLGYQAWLMSEEGGSNGVNTANKNLQFLKTVVRAAVDEGLLEYAQNPFLKLKLSFEKVERPRLSPEEIERLRDVEGLTPIERVSRDLWLFQYYTAGARIGDAIRTKWSQIVGARWLYAMEKTGEDRGVKLSAAAQELLVRYRTPDARPTDYVFPLLDSLLAYTPSAERKAVESKTAQVNEALKRVAAKAEIEKKLSSHIARHSFADQAIKKGVSVVSVQHALGHKSLGMTHRYLASFDQGAADDAIDAVLGE